MEELMSVPEVARILHVRRQTIYNWLHRGQIPCVRLNSGNVRFRPSDIEEWLRSKTCMDTE